MQRAITALSILGLLFISAESSAAGTCRKCMEGCEELCAPKSDDCASAQKAVDDAQIAYDQVKKELAQARKDARESYLNNRIRMDSQERREKGRDLRDAQEKLMGLKALEDELKSHPTETATTSEFPSGITGSPEDLQKIADAIADAQDNLNKAQADFDYAESELRKDLAEKRHIEDLERDEGAKQQVLQKAKDLLKKCQSH